MVEHPAALGPAGNILEFITFLVKLVKEVQALRASADGATLENRNLEETIQRLNKLNEGLQQRPAETLELDGLR